jgi:uncharacterized protein YyaL (SSP411 family)
MSNSLKTATSLFLQQHKDNPVQWRSWSPQVLADAKAQDKPILLSIGYAGCFGSGALNKESFSDEGTATFINDNYIPVLVDRDERPDLDQIYQATAGAMGHPGGWPLNLFLNPEGVPFWAAGYLPKEERAGEITFRALLNDTATLYKDKDKVGQTVDTLRTGMDSVYSRDMRTAPENINLDLAALRIAQRYDIFFGGLQGPIKFPHFQLLEVLWRAFLRTGTPQFSQLVFTTLDGLLFGGTYDHVGGGVFRHAIDERYLLPQFEKSLYDNAMLIDLCTEVWQFNGNELCRQRVEQTIDWLLREMKTGEGFAAAQAGEEGDPGRYYTWSEAEIDVALMGTFSARFKQIYGVSRDGNYMGRNVLRRLGNPAPASAADEALLIKQIEMLRIARDKRPAPLRDDKLVADWNGLAIAAIARAGAVFGKPDWVRAAIAAFDHVVATLGDDARLSHSAMDGVKGAGGFADDYANMARAALQLREVTGEDRFLDQSKTWVKTLADLFWNEEKGGYHYTASDADPLFVRSRMLFDSPAPAANGTMLVVLTRLALITGEMEYMSRATNLGMSFGDEMNRVLNGAGSFINGYEYLATSLVILVIGHKGNGRTQDLIRAVWSKALPNGLLVQVEPNEALPEGHPATGQTMKDGHPTAFICQQGNCSQPITDPNQLAQILTLPLQQTQQQVAN